MGDFHGRSFVDSAPVYGKILGRDQRTRLGRQKRKILIHKKRGSFFFIATLIVDLELASMRRNRLIIAEPVPDA